MDQNLTIFIYAFALHTKGGSESIVCRAQGSRLTIMALLCLPVY